MKLKIQMMTFLLSVVTSIALAQEVSPYMGGEVNLTKAPNGAIARDEVFKIGAQISYLEPISERYT